MLLGHNWVMNGSYSGRQISHKFGNKITDYIVQESGNKWVIIGSKWKVGDGIEILTF